jgi:hypothetical protein
MKLKHALPGLVWIAIGAGVYIYGEQSGKAIVVRGTSVSWGLVVMATGVVVGVWGLIKNRKQI